MTGGVVWHTWQGEFRGDWSGWHSLERPPGPGSAIGGSALARNRDGRLELFTMLSDGTLWHRWQTGPGRGPWHDWHSLERPGGNGFASPGAPPALASNPDGRLELVALAPTADGDLEVWQREQTAPNDGWIRWKSFGSPAKVFARLADFSEGLDRIGPPTLVHDGQRRLRLWSLAPGLVDGRITKFYNLAQTLPSGDDWTHGISLFSPPPDPQPAYIPQPADSPPA